jgi:hypothetical protein
MGMGDRVRKDVAAQLNAVVKSLESSIEVTAACGCQITTKLLQMARLHLLCEIHGIEDAEFQAFADELARKQQPRKDSVVYLDARRRVRDTRS